MADIIPILPKHGFTRAELLGPGPRTNVQHLVPSVKTLAQAFTDAQYGDDVICDFAATTLGPIDLPVWTTKTVTNGTPRFPTLAPRGGHQARTQTLPRLAAHPRKQLIRQGPVSYIHVKTSGTLPALTPETISGIDAYGAPYTMETFEGSARVTEDDYGAMHTWKGLLESGGGRTLTSALTALSPTKRPARWRFQGIRFQQADGGAVDFNSLIAIAGPDTVGNGSQSGNGEWHFANHLLFVQCAVEGDPQETGRSTQFGYVIDGQYIGWLGCHADKIYGTTGGESAVIWVTGGGGGPFHSELSRLSTLGIGAFFGGSGWTRRAISSDLTIRRNWVYKPFRWHESEVRWFNSGVNWNVTVAANGVSVTRNAGQDFTGFNQFPRWVSPGCIMYDVATGRAARVGSIPGTSSFTLEEAWPVAGPVTIDVGFMKAVCLYASGRTGDGSTATVNGTTAVTVSAPLPASVLVGHYFHLANVRSTNPGAWVPIQTRRRITAIAGDRLSFTLATAYPESTTFPYMIVLWDGRLRGAAPKNTWEHKHGQRILAEGNVFENVWEGLQNQGWTMHPTNQDVGGGFGGVTPWAKCGDVTFRWNIQKYMLGAVSTYGQTPNNSRPVEKGYRFKYHDCLFIGIGDRRLGSFSGGANGMLGFMSQSGYGTLGGNDDLTWAHITMVKNTPNPNGGRIALIGASANCADYAGRKSRNLILRDCIVTDMLPSASWGILAGDCNSDPIAINDYTDSATRLISGNVWTGTSAPAKQALYTTGDMAANAGVTVPAAVGFADYANENFVLTDLYTAGTVTVTSAANSIVTLVGASLPNTVQKGQFFKVNSVGTLMRIKSVESTTQWTLVGDYGAQGPGAGYTITFKGSATDGADPGCDIPTLLAVTAGVTD